MLRFLLLVVQIVFIPAYCIGQSHPDTTHANVIIHSKDDPCPDPISESMLYFARLGRVIEIQESGAVIIQTEDSQIVHVKMVGIKMPVFNEPYGAETLQYLNISILGKPVRVGMLPDFRGKNNVAGVIYELNEDLYKIESQYDAMMLQDNVYHDSLRALESRVEGSLSVDINLALVHAGFAKYAKPAPHALSLSMDCQYKRASDAACSAKIGIWKFDK
jgi:hypothetical protein